MLKPLIVAALISLTAPAIAQSYEDRAAAERAAQQIADYDRMRMEQARRDRDLDRKTTAQTAPADKKTEHDPIGWVLFLALIGGAVFFGMKKR